MKSRLAATAVLAALALLGLAEDPPERPSEKLRGWMSARAVGILKGAKRVECFRVFPEKPNEPMGNECGAYPVTSTAKAQEEKFAARLVDILFDDKTYDFEKAKKCEFSPGVGYRLWNDKEWVDVTLCFSCDELEISHKPPGAKELSTAHEDFDAARAALVKLAKEAFPEDKEIQGLTEKREKK